MQYVQIVLTDSQAGLVATAVKNAMLDAEDPIERDQLAALADFMYAVEANPAGFPVTDPGMRRSIKKRIARLKGPAQPKPNKRKRTQARKQSFQTRTRAMKREEARLQREAFQAAQAALEIEQAQADRERAESLGIILPE